MLSQTLHHTGDNAQLQRTWKYFKQQCIRIIECQTFKKTNRNRHTLCPMGVENDKQYIKMNLLVELSDLLQNQCFILAYQLQHIVYTPTLHRLAIETLRLIVVVSFTYPSLTTNV